MPTYFEENHIRQVLQAINIIDVVGSYVALKPRGREHIGLCPFHDDRRPSMNVSESKQIFKCFACGAGGNAFNFIMLREQMTFPEAVRMLADRAGVKLPERTERNTQLGDRNELELLNRWAVRFFRGQYEDAQQGKRIREYVEDRGITAQTAQAFDLGWAPDGWDNLLKSAQAEKMPLQELVRLGLLVEKEQGGYYDRFRERLMFPVRDALGRVIGFGGRTLGDDPAKYLNSPESVLFNKSRTLYGLDLAKDSIVKEQTAVVVEGYTDCLMAHQFGLSNVVATLGTALTTEHAGMISRYSDKIVLVFDSDEAGQKAADRAIEVFFSKQVEVALVNLPSGSDPCDFLLENGKKSFEELVRDAVPALEYKWRVMLRQLEGVDSVNGHKRAVEEFLRLVAQSIASGNMDMINQGYLFNRVAKLVGVTGEQVQQKVNQFLRRTKTATVAARTDELIVSDGQERSEREVLEVLLNRPDMFGQVREVIPDAEGFSEGPLKQIARRLWDYFGQGGTGSLGEILAGCESTQLCRIMTDLSQQGSDRENYEMTLVGALEKLRVLNRKQERQDLSEQISQAGKKYGKDAEAALLMEFHSKNQSDPRHTRALNR